MSAIQFDHVPVYVKEFVLYYRNIKNASEKTVYEYFLDLRLFFRFIQLTDDGIDLYANSYKQDLRLLDELFDKTDASKITLSRISKLELIDFYEYMNFCNTVRHDGVAIRARKTSCLKVFFTYLLREGKIDRNPTEFLNLPKQPSSLPIYLTEKQSIELLESIDGENKTRNYAIITLFLNCGMRLSELVGINLSDFADQTVRITGKGNKTRIVYLNDACQSAIAEYLKVRPKEGLKEPDSKALFISRNKKRISNRMVQTLVKDFITKAGLDPNIYTTHKLRHTAATLMINHGTDVLAVKEVLGHSNLSTTQIYTHLSSDLLEAAMNSNPLSSVKAPPATDSIVEKNIQKNDDGQDN